MANCRPLTHPIGWNCLVDFKGYRIGAGFGTVDDDR